MKTNRKLQAPGNWWRNYECRMQLEVNLIQSSTTTSPVITCTCIYVTEKFQALESFEVVKTQLFCMQNRITPLCLIFGFVIVWLRLLEEVERSPRDPKCVISNQQCVKQSKAVERKRHARLLQQRGVLHLSVSCAVSQ